MLKRFILIFILAVLLFSSFPVDAENNTSGDIPSNWAGSYVDNVKNIPSLGIDRLANNYQKDITRGEFAYLSVKLYEYYTGQEILEGRKYFKDTADEWVLKAKRAGLINGYSDNTFRPNESIRREEIAAMFVNVFIAADMLYKESSSEIFKDDSSISKWAKRSVYIAKANNIISGIGGNIFNPSGLVTREQAFVMLSNVVSSVKPDLLRQPKLGVDKIVLKDVESSTQTNIRNSISPNIRVDKIDYPFEPDDSVLGQWNAVDYVSDPLLFNPEKPHTAWLFLDSVIFYESGSYEYRTYDYYENGTWVEKSEYRLFQAKWTKGLVMENNQDQITSSRYFLATVENKEYLFLEYKNGDYIYRNATPRYYVFTKSE